MGYSDPRPVSDLLGDAVRQASDLIRTEIALARAEATAKAGGLARGVAMIAAGAVLLTPALTLLLFGVASALATAGLSMTNSYLATGFVVAVLAVVIVALGAKRFSANKLTPQVTISELRRDKAAVREMAR